MKMILKTLIRAYACVVSPMTGAKCRFYPTCSGYTADAIETHGAAKGLVMGAKRLMKCHPYYKGDMIDPVPQRIDWPGILGYKRRKGACPCPDHNMKEKI